MTKAFLFVSLGILTLVSLFSALTNIGQVDWYDEQWAIVDAYDQQGLPRSALEVVELIYGRAKKEGNEPHLIKSLLYRSKYSTTLEEDSINRILTDLRSNLEDVTVGSRSIIQSILGDVYWRFLQANRYQFYDRTPGAETDDDVNTWDLRRIISTALDHYRASLVDAEQLNVVALEDYVVLLAEQPETRALRPTLYDLLAHRALDVFMNGEAGLVEPKESFVLDAPAYLVSAEDFVALSIESPDDLSLEAEALRILQTLIRLHATDADPAALVHADLRRLSYVRTFGVGTGKDTLFLNALDSLHDQFIDHEMSADVLFQKARTLDEIGNTYSPGDDEETRWRKKEAVETCDQAIAEHGDSFGADNCRALQVQISQKELEVESLRDLVPNQKSLARISYRNVGTVYFRVYETDRETVMRWERMPTSDRDKYIDEKLSTTPVFSTEISLLDDGDFQRHATEVAMPALRSGTYVVIASPNPAFEWNGSVRFAGVAIASNISYTSRNRSDGSIQFYVLNRETGASLAKALLTEYDRPVRRGDQDLVPGSTYVTDRDGYVETKTRERQNVVVTFEHSEDWLVSDNMWVNRYGSGENKSRSTRFFTDRAIYRPGQPIYFKGILLSRDGENYSIRANAATNVELFDVNGESVASLDLRSNEFGTVSGQFIAPRGVLTGNMRIADTDGSVSFSVEEYKRPRFEVLMEPIAGEYELNQETTVTGTAKSYAGANLGGVSVRYRVTRSVYFPWRIHGWWPPPRATVAEIANGTTQTDADGRFEVTFNSKADASLDPESQPVFNFIVAVDVTDISGETHSTSTSVSAGYRSLLLDLSMPDRLDRTQSEPFGITSTNLSGQPVASAGRVRVVRLEEPPIRLPRKWQLVDRPIVSAEEMLRDFPHEALIRDGRSDTDPSTWDEGRIVYNEPYDTSDKTSVQFDAGRWPLGTYVFEISGTDIKGRPVTNRRYVRVFSSKGDSVPGKVLDWFSLSTPVVEPGGTARVLVGSSEKDVRILVEVERAGEILEKRWFDVSNEQREFRFPIEEHHRGNIAIHAMMVRHNRFFTNAATVAVPYTNKQLHLTWETFRNKLYPGEQETWRLKIGGPNGDKVAAELMATMYDASLDQFRSQYWNLSLWPQYGAQRSWRGDDFARRTSYHQRSTDWNERPNFRGRSFDALNFFGFYYYGGGRFARMEMAKEGAVLRGLPLEPDSPVEEAVADMEQSSAAPTPPQTAIPAAPPPRRNLRETAFFFPTLRTDSDGNVTLEFTMPEALTRWRFLGLAHTKDLKVGVLESATVTQKELMVTPNPPRFVREGDRLTFSAKVDNLTEDSLSGTATLQLVDALSMEPIDTAFGNTASTVAFVGLPRGAAALEWDLTVPEGVSAVTYRVSATAGEFTDGEEAVLPVLTNRMLVTESLPLPMRSAGTKRFVFDKLANNESPTLRHERLTLEYSPNPIWYAVQALPYLMEYPYECSEQVFSRFYANGIAAYIVSSNPRIERVYDAWRRTDAGALLSNLEKNQDLKALLLEETPWVTNAKDESERKKRVGLLFDTFRMRDELSVAISKLSDMQLDEGAWPWFPGMGADRFVTQHIVKGIGTSRRIGVIDLIDDGRPVQMAINAIDYMDREIAEDYDRLVGAEVDLDLKHIGYQQVHYLYARSFFGEVDVPEETATARKYYLDQAREYWLQFGLYTQGMIALALEREGDHESARAIVASLKERSLDSDEMGMYWKAGWGYMWYEAPIETQSLLIEVFHEVANDEKSVDAMQLWLLKQKQTQDWKTTKATTDAVYALLMRGTNLIDDAGQVTIALGGEEISSTSGDAEMGTGYVRKSWPAASVERQMAEVTVTKTGAGPAWGALYWQYFEQLDRITPAETPLQLEKQLFRQTNTDAGPVLEEIEDGAMLSPGDLVKVRIVLRVDRAMEYVHLKDMRAAGFEPIDVLSGYRYQDYLGYYESTRDAATNFFISYLPKGTFVFEYPLRANLSGNFSNGVTSIQSMYAPEFGAHSEGIRVEIAR